MMHTTSYVGFQRGFLVTQRPAKQAHERCKMVNNEHPLTVASVPLAPAALAVPHWASLGLPVPEAHSQTPHSPCPVPYTAQGPCPDPAHADALQPSLRFQLLLAELLQNGHHPRRQVGHPVGTAAASTHEAPDSAPGATFCCAYRSQLGGRCGPPHSPRSGVDTGPRCTARALPGMRMGHSQQLKTQPAVVNRPCPGTRRRSHARTDSLMVQSQLLLCTANQARRWRLVLTRAHSRVCDDAKARLAGDALIHLAQCCAHAGIWGTPHGAAVC